MAPPDGSRSDSGQLSPGTTTCRDCHRMVRMVDVGGDRLVATDPELISVVPSGIRRGVAHARRLHAERCADYQEQERRRATTADLRRWNRRRGRGTGL